jgi:hypothetical protein
MVNRDFQHQFTSILRLFYQIYAKLSTILHTSSYRELNGKHVRIMGFCCSTQQLIRWSLAVGLLAAFLAPGSAQAQGPTGPSTGPSTGSGQSSGQGLWQTFTTANSSLDHNYMCTLPDGRYDRDSLQIEYSFVGERVVSWTK